MVDEGAISGGSGGPPALVTIAWSLAVCMPAGHTGSIYLNKLITIFTCPHKEHMHRLGGIDWHGMLHPITLVGLQQFLQSSQRQTPLLPALLQELSCTRGSLLLLPGNALHLIKKVLPGPEELLVGLPPPGTLQLHLLHGLAILRMHARVVTPDLDTRVDRLQIILWPVQRSMQGTSVQGSPCKGSVA